MTVISLLLLLAASSVLTNGQSGGEVVFLALGDWGDTALPGQQQVAYAMASWAEVNNPQFVISTGDNFYPNGVRGVDDPQWTNKWVNVYNNDSLANLPWYISVGNHDYGNDKGEEWNQVEYSLQVDDRWVLPHLWHSFTRPLGDSGHHVLFISFDTEALRLQRNNYTDMMAWLDATLAASTARWKIVFGHRPIYSTGDYGPIQGVTWEQLRPILEQYGVDVFLCGHDHNLQHISAVDGGGIDYVISGAGGALWYPYEEEHEQVLNATYGMQVNAFHMVWGFTGFHISDTELRWDFFNADEELLYSYTRTK